MSAKEWYFLILIIMIWRKCVLKCLFCCSGMKKKEPGNDFQAFRLISHSLVFASPEVD